MSAIKKDKVLEKIKPLLEAISNKYPEMNVEIGTLTPFIAKIENGEHTQRPEFSFKLGQLSRKLIKHGDEKIALEIGSILRTGSRH